MEHAREITPGPASRVVPNRIDALRFVAKASVLRLRRAGQDLLSGPDRHRRGPALADAPILAEVVSSLWSGADDDGLLTAGKVQNLRIAAARLDGVVVPAGQVLGFWRQVGRATAGKGFVVGRELREGCLVPSVGGGLCQLSNGLHDAALSAGLEIVERHAHSRIVPGSQAAQGRDATVFWNYVDLRVRGRHDWRIEAGLDAETLRIRIRSEAPAPMGLSEIQGRSTLVAQANACHACDGVGCWRREGPRPTAVHRTWIQCPDEWSEFAAYRAAHQAPGDRVLVPQDARPSWPWRLWRRWSQRGVPLPQRRIADSERQARALARRLHHADRVLVVPQALLVPWWRAGVLGGRRFQVLMTALPAAALQEVLDRAARLHPDSRTLVDFRSDADWLDDEAAALARADSWITPHRAILSLAGNRGVPLAWDAPSCSRSPDHPATSAIDPGRRVLLPASSLARKGVHTLRAALQGMDVSLLLPPGAEEAPNFWSGCSVRRVASIEAGIVQADVVVLPAWVEHQPRGLLLALASGIPVIATQACGLAESEHWRQIPAGDVAALRQALLGALQPATPRRMPLPA